MTTTFPVAADIEDKSPVVRNDVAAALKRYMPPVFRTAAEVQSIDLGECTTFLLTDNAGGLTLYSYDAAETGAHNGTTIVVDSSGRRFVYWASFGTLGLVLRGATTEDKSIEIGAGRSGDGASFIDLIGDATHSDHGARFVRFGGANANTHIDHRGTGQLVIRSVEAGPIGLYTNSVQRIHIDDTGVGIGIVSHDGTLHAHSGSAGSVTADGSADEGIFESSGAGGITLLTPAASSSNIYFGSPSNSIGGVLRWEHTANLFTIGTNNGSASLRFMTGGFTENSRLDGSGNWRLNAYGAGTLQTDASGNVTASSDERLKDNITPSNIGLDEVLQINPIAYTWSPQSGFDQLNTYLGVSAQNVEAAIPQAVGMGSDGYLTVNDRPLIAALINAVKTLKTENDDLRVRINALEAA